MRVESVRISVQHGSSARHFWETAIGLRVCGESEITDGERLRAWGMAGAGAVRVTRMELSPERFPKVELVEWENCGGKPIRNPQHPWNYGLLALRVPVTDLRARLDVIAGQWRCPVVRRGDGSAVVTSPAGEQVILAEGGELEAVAVVPSIAAAGSVLSGWFGLKNGFPARSLMGFSGAATVDQMVAKRYEGLEIVEFARSADPRPALDLSDRMNFQYTGYCMLALAGGSWSVRRGPAGIPVEVMGA